jgi:hypothetical protein
LERQANALRTLAWKNYSMLETRAGEFRMEAIMTMRHSFLTVLAAGCIAAVTAFGSPCALAGSVKQGKNTHSTSTGPDINVKTTTTNTSNFHSQGNVKRQNTQTKSK